MFLEFLNKWLEWRYTKQTSEVRSYHRIEVPDIPEGYYAVVSVELKLLHEPPHLMELAKDAEKELVLA